jgi:hypothetical protein
MNGIDILIQAYLEQGSSEGERLSAVEQERYESSVIDEARAIVAGKSLKLASVEHLRIALSWLDCARAGEPDCSEQSAPF